MPRTTPFDRALSVAGAVGLLALVLAGPAGLVVPVVVVAVAAATGVWSHGRRSVGTVGPPSPQGTGRTAPELRDRWRAWRVAEPDPEFLRGRAA